MIRIHSLKTKVEENVDLKKIVSKKLNVTKEEIKDLKIHKRSIDARSKETFSYVFDIDVSIDNEDKYINNYIEKVVEENYSLPSCGNEKLNKRPVVVGAGPAGLFAALELAKAGFKPIVIERGEKVENRVNTVNLFWDNGIFNEKSNVQFGEGGAGTFSDGKLNTLVKNKENRMNEVFNTFVECGAHDDILYDKLPHIGTDVLREVIINLRNKIISLGGEFRYNSLLQDIIINNSKLEAVVVNDEVIDTDVLVLAIGHSARDTFRMLHEKGFDMESKPFAVGIRIIHPQDMINKNQYPINYDFLPSASYKLTYKSASGRGIYSFCMCPGGYVVDARSTTNGVVVNGMSNYLRDSGYANSAIVVTVDKEDYGNELFDGLKFQEDIENKAYQLSNGLIPIQKYVDYKLKNVSNNVDVCGVKGKTCNVDINLIFPEYLNNDLKEGIDYFGKKIKGFNEEEAVILAPEARTSSPIRILRNDNLESNILGVYPVGEGAGFAGGITTSAMDGIKAAEEIIKKYYV